MLGGTIVRDERYSAVDTKYSYHQNAAKWPFGPKVNFKKSGAPNYLVDAKMEAKLEDENMPSAYC